MVLLQQQLSIIFHQPLRTHVSFLSSYSVIREIYCSPPLLLKTCGYYLGFEGDVIGIIAGTPPERAMVSVGEIWAMWIVSNNEWVGAGNISLEGGMSHLVPRGREKSCLGVLFCDS